MLSEVIFASVGIKEEGSKREPGISASSLYPCAYRLYKAQKGESNWPDPTAQQLLNMADGWDQEEKTVKRLKKAGVEIYNRQNEIRVGRSGIPGHFDGMVNILGEEMIWEHKAWASTRFDSFVSLGINSCPGEKAQSMAYALGQGVSKIDFMVLKKESNDYHDIIIPLDRDYIDPILEWSDKIRLEDWVPEPKECKWCSTCGFNCFGTVLDFSKTESFSSDEMADRWKKGKALQDVGGMLIQEARDFFIGTEDKLGNKLTDGLIGTKTSLLVSGLEIKKIIQHRSDVSKSKVLKEFGSEGLMKVIEEKEIPQYRFRAV